MGTDPTRRVMYMHTLDGKPASFYDMHGMQFLATASKGHRTRAARLVGSLDRIYREHQRCVASDWEQFNAMKREYRPDERPSLKRYGYILVEVPRG